MGHIFFSKTSSCSPIYWEVHLYCAFWSRLARVNWSESSSKGNVCPSRIQSTNTSSYLLNMLNFHSAEALDRPCRYTSRLCESLRLSSGNKMQWFLQIRQAYVWLAQQRKPLNKQHVGTGRFLPVRADSFISDNNQNTQTAHDNFMACSLQRIRLLLFSFVLIL